MLVALSLFLATAGIAQAQTASFEGDPRPLIEAIDRNDARRVQSILDAGVNPSDFGNTNYAAIHAAAAKGNTQIAALLLRKGVNVDLRGKGTQAWTPLFYAVEWGQTEMVKFLIDKGANVNARGGNGYPILHMATTRGQNSVPIMRLLIDRGANVNASADNKTTVLESASESNNTEGFIFLLNRGADPEALGTFETTVITSAVLSKNESIIALLLKRHVSLTHFSSYKGYAPLHWAAHDGEVRIIRMLLSAGANPAMRAKDGGLPEEIARERGNMEAAHLLQLSHQRAR